MARTPHRCCASSRRWRSWTTSRRSTRTTTFPTRSSKPSPPPDLRRSVPSRVLGVDPGLVGTGWALLEPRSAAPAVIDTGVIETSADLPLAARVHAIYDALHVVLDKHAPDLMVLEDLYTEYKFPRTAILMAHARGVVCLAARQHGVDLLALAPAVVKRVVAGHGAASKEQVQQSVRRLLGLAEVPRPSHVADALALAFTALSRRGAPLP